MLRAGCSAQEFYVRVVILASPQPPEEGGMPTSHLRYQTSRKLLPDFQKIFTFIHCRVSQGPCALDKCDPSSYCYHLQTRRLKPRELRTCVQGCTAGQREGLSRLVGHGSQSSTSEVSIPLGLTWKIGVSCPSRGQGPGDGQGQASWASLLMV